MNQKTKTIELLEEDMGESSEHWICQQFLRYDTKSTGNKSKNK